MSATCLIRKFATPKVTLNDKLAGTLPPGVYWDQHPDAPRNFLLWVGKTERTYRLNYYNRGGRERRVSIGSPPAWLVKDARKAAAELQRYIDQGGDPLADAQQHRAAPTVAELWQRFETEALPSRAASTQSEYRSMMRHYVLPGLGTLKVASVTRADIETLHRRITAAGHTRRANAVKSLVSTLLNCAVGWEMRDTNPTQHIKHNVEHRRERYLSEAEVARLLDEVERCRVRGGHWADTADKIALAIHTGARRGEILNITWAQLADLDGAAPTWILPSTATKEGQRTGRNKRLPLAPGAVAILQRRRAELQAGNIVPLRDGAVFKHGNSRTGTSSLEEDWERIRTAAGIDGVRFHDLRHSFASFAISGGVPLATIGVLLGHSTPQTTQRYAHLSDAAARAAAVLIGQKIGGKRTVENDTTPPGHAAGGPRE